MSIMSSPRVRKGSKVMVLLKERIDHLWIATSNIVRIYTRANMTKSKVIPLMCGTKFSHIYRQISATFACFLLGFTVGLILGFTSVLLPQMEADESFPYDKSFDSWIVSISPLAMAVACLFAGSFSDKIGRKMSLILLTIPVSVGWIIIGFSNSNVIILIGRFVTGFCSGSIIPISMVYVGEITNPTYRSITLFSISASMYLGILISHVVGKYVYWKISCFLFITPNVVALIILLLLKESPLWLLNKSTIEEGIDSFKLFRGSSESSQKELEAVLSKFNKTEETSFRETIYTIFSKQCMKSLSCIFFLFVSSQWSGVNAISFYAQDIFQKTFNGDIDAFLLMIITDCIRTVAAVVVCFLAKNIPKKTAFVACCFGVTLVLGILLVYLYLQPKDLVWLAVTCMVIYIAIASILTCVSWSFISEIFPGKMRGLGSALSSLISFILLFICVKVTPEILTNFGVLAMYGCFAVATLIAGICMIYMLPETNGKSLQEIEDTLYSVKDADKLNSDTTIVTRF